MIQVHRQQFSNTILVLLPVDAGVLKARAQLKRLATSAIVSVRDVSDIKARLSFLQRAVPASCGDPREP